MKITFTRSDLLAGGISIGALLLSLIGMQRDPTLIWAALFFGACAAILLLQPLLARRLASREARVVFDADAIRTTLGHSVVGAIRWDDVDTITIFTRDTGPLDDDLVWMFANAARSKVLLIPGTIAGFPELLEKLTQLPGFDHAALLEALGCVTAERFVVWHRPTA